MPLLDELQLEGKPKERPGYVPLAERLFPKTPARERMEAAPKPEAPDIERLKTLEYEQLPITTPKTFREMTEKAGEAMAPVPRAVGETALATGLGLAQFMSGVTGWRMISELVAGAPLDEAIERGGGGIYSYEPSTALAQKMTEVVNKPFELVRKGVEWVVPQVLRGQMMLTPEQYSEIERQSKLLPYVATALGTVMELGTYAAFGKAIKARVGKGKPTPTDITEAAKSTVKLRKKGVPAERPEISPEAKALAEKITAEMEGRQVLARDVATGKLEPVIDVVRKTEEGLPVKKTLAEEIVTEPKPEVGELTAVLRERARKLEAEPKVEPEPVVPKEPIPPDPVLANEVAGMEKGGVVEIEGHPVKYDGPWKGLDGEITHQQYTPQPGSSIEGATFMTVGPTKDVQLVRDRLAYHVKDREAKRALRLPPEPAPKIRVVKPKPIDKRIQKRIIEADDNGVAPDEIAAQLKLRESQVTDVLESVTAKRKTVTMAEVEAEFGRIADEMNKLPEAEQLDFLYNKTRELAARYEGNLDAGFADPLDLARYREWGDQVVSKINNIRRKAGKVIEPPTETLEFGGFQKLYEMFVGKTLKRGEVRGRPLTPEGEALLRRGTIIKQRKVKDRTYPPVYEGEYQLLKSSKVLEERWFRRAFENPIRVFEEAGGEALLDLTIHPYHAAEKAFTIAWRAAQKNINTLREGVGWKSRRRIMTYAVSEQVKGPQLLKYMKIKDVPKLTEAELVTYNALRARYESLYVRLNRVRRAIGVKEFPKTDDYFTFFRDLTMMEQMGFRPFRMPADTLEAQFVKMRATPFKYAKARTRALYRLEMDPFYVLERYTQTALRHMHLSPLIAKLHELELGLKDPATGSIWKLVNENPILARSLRGWIDFVAGKKPGFSLGPFDAVMQRVNSNLAASILGANVRSAMIQVTALRNTVAEIGFRSTFKGIESLISPTKRDFALRKSKVLTQRSYDVSVEDAIRAIRAGRAGQVKAAVGRAALKPLQLLDIETAKATWNGAYEYGTKQLKMGEKRAINYADDVVTRTQASAMPGDVAPVQRPVVGKFFTLFQTFTINDWNFLVRDVLGKRNVTYETPGALAKTMRFVAATTLFNILMEDVLHVNSPFPTPIRAFSESLERGDDLPSLAWNVSKEFIEPIPIIGAARYGLGPGGPGFELARESVKYISGDPMRKPGAELGGKWIGLPGTAQIAKSVRAAKRGETTYGQVVGTYTPPTEGRARRQRPKTGRRTR